MYDEIDNDMFGEFGDDLEESLQLSDSFDEELEVPPDKTEPNFYENVRYPMLLIGAEVIDFKKYNRSHEGYPIIHFNDLEHVREVVSYYSLLKELERPVILEDLSFLSSPGLLLKFLEESPLRIICLSLYDQLNPILYSRFRLIKKKPMFKTESEFGKPSVALQKISALSENTSYYDKVRTMSRYSPVLFYLSKTMSQKAYRFFS